MTLIYLQALTLALSALALFVTMHAYWARLSPEQVAALTEAAYYSALHPSWPQIHANGQTYAMLPEDAMRLQLRDGCDMDLRELATLLIELRNEEPRAIYRGHQVGDYE